MSTIYCNACNLENHSHSIKCEQCKAPLNQENINSTHDEWENDFLFIENAEIKGQIFKLENLGDDEKISLGIKEITNDEIVQAVKEEPEFHIESDFLGNQEQAYNNNNKSPYQCSTCYKCFKRKAGLLCHIKAAHDISDSESEHYSDAEAKKQSKIISRIPSNISKFNSSKYQDENKSTQSIIIKCDQCNESFASNTKLNAHRKVCATKEKFPCNVCDIFVSSKSALMKHNKSRQHLTCLEKPSGKETRKFVCPFCGERFPLQILLTNHKKGHNEESMLLSESTRIERVDGRLTYICRICDKTTTNKSGHTEHLRVHTKEKPAKCDLCGSSFTTRSSLVRHMSLHSDERPFECNICGVNYRHKRNLRKHLFMHTGERPFKCKYCDKTFALRFTFNDHVRLLHTKETPYQCENCMKSFKTSYLLNLHRRKEHNIDTNTKPKVKIFDKNMNE